MIAYPWTANWEAQGQDINEFKYFKRWFEEIGERPAVKRGMAAGKDLSSDTSKLPEEEQARIRKVLYNQRAIPAPAWSEMERASRALLYQSGRDRL